MVSPDDINNIVFELHNLLTAMDRVPDDDDDYVTIQNFMYEALEPFVTRDQNYN
jgi:hypothetical protein